MQRRQVVSRRSEAGTSAMLWRKVYLAATASGNDLKLVEFSGVVNASQKVRASKAFLTARLMPAIRTCA